jgi:hypothetical protein
VLYLDENRGCHALALLGLAFHSRESLGDSPEKLLHVVPDLRAGLDVNISPKETTSNDGCAC